MIKRQKETNSGKTHKYFNAPGTEKKSRNALAACMALAFLGQAGWAYGVCPTETAAGMYYVTAPDSCTASLTSYSDLTTDHAHVLMVQNAGARLTHIASFTVNISGFPQANSHGVLAWHGGAAYLKGATIRQTGVLTTSNSAMRAMSDVAAGSSISVEGDVTLDTEGIGARGIYASGPGIATTVTLNSSGTGTSRITTRGLAAPAIQIGKILPSGTGGATFHAKARLEAETTSTSASYSSPALYIAKDGSSFNADYPNSSGRLSSATRTILLSAGNDMAVSLRSYAVTATGGGAAIAPIYVGGGATNSTITLSGASSVIAPSNGYLVLSEGKAIDDANTYNPTGTAGAVSSSLRLEATEESQLTGSISTDGSSTLHVVLDDSTWTLAGYNGALNTPSTLTSLTLANGAILNAAGSAADYTIVAAAPVSSTGSTISLRDNAVGDTLTIDADLALSGGIIAIDTQLGGDTSPTDLLVVTGDTTGNGILSVANIGGSGAATTNGIKVIEVQGSSSATFSLASRLVAGSWEYTLSKKADGWYLLAGPYTATPANIPVNAPWALALLGLMLSGAAIRYARKK